MNGANNLISLPRRVLRRIPAAVVIALFGLFVIATAWISTLQRTSREQVEEMARIERENAGLARAFEEHVRRMIETADNALLYLQLEYEKHAGITDSMTDFVERAGQGSVVNQLSLSGPTGDLLLSAVPMKKPINIAYREHFQAHLKNDGLGLYIAKPVVMQLSGTWTFFLTRRLKAPDGSFDGIVSAGMDPKYFSEYYSIPELGPTRSIGLVGRDGIVRARRFKTDVAVGQDISRGPLLGAVQRAPVGSYESISLIDGLRRITCYRALSDYPLIVFVADLKDAALAPLARRRLASYLFTLVFSLVVAAFCLVLIRFEGRTQRQNKRLAEELVERRKVEEALRESQDLFSSFMDHMRAAVFVKDLRGNVLYANRGCRELLGGDAAVAEPGALTATLGELCAQLAVDDERVLREESIVVEGPVTDRSGLVRVFESRKFVIDRGRKEPLLGSISIDVSDRKKAEEQRLLFERQLQQSQKLESLGMLAGGIAHDFNNLLMVILGNNELALMQSSPESPVRAYLQNIDQATQRAADLTTQMLAYSGKGRFVVEPINLSRLVREMGHLMGTVISKEAVVHYYLAPDLPSVIADPTQMRQVVMNLITNASDALGEGEGVITVTTGVTEIEDPLEPSGITDRLLPTGRYVFLRVSDSGAGMDELTRARIFDPFFTTKRTGRGLGLAVVLGIIHGHRGGIRVSSEPGQGTTIEVLIPSSPEPCPPPKVPAAAQPPAAAVGRRPHGLILLVDDEAGVRTTAAEMIKEGGYGVITAADGIEALEIFRATSAELAAVVLDMTMPRMGGEAAFEEMRRIDARVPVILSSGYDEQDAVSRFTGRGLAGFIQKPYRLTALLDRIQAALAGRQ